MTTQLFVRRSLNRRFFGLKVERPKAEPGKVLVLSGGHGNIVLWPGQKPTPGEAAWGAYNSVYEIDMGARDLSFVTSIPARGGDAAFQLTFSAGYKVSDPIRVINEQLVNPEPLLRRVITESSSRVTEKFDIEDSTEALAAIREMLDKKRYTEKLPFDLNAVNVKLDLDSHAKDFLNQRRQQKRQAILAQESGSLISSTAEAGKLKQRYDLELQQRQEEFDVQIEKMRVEGALAIQRMRMEVYRPMIEGGMWAVLVQQLAQNPDDIDKVSSLILQMHQQQSGADLSMLQALLDGDMLEDRHLKEVTSNLVRRLQRNTTGSLQLGADDQKRLASNDGQPNKQG